MAPDMSTPQTHTLPAGTLVERGGIVFLLKNATLIECHADNWPDILRGHLSPERSDWTLPIHDLAPPPSLNPPCPECLTLPRTSLPKSCACLPPTCSDLEPASAQPIPTSSISLKSQSIAHPACPSSYQKRGSEKPETLFSLVSAEHIARMAGAL